MQFLPFVAFHPFRQAGRIVQVCSALQPFLQLADAAFDRLEHLLCLVACVAEDQDPSVLAQFLAHGLCVGLECFVVAFQLVATVF